MGVRAKNLIGVCALAVASAMLPAIAQAQDARSTTRYVGAPIPEAFDRAVIEESKDFYENRSIKRQVTGITGLGNFRRNAFPENEIARDGRRVNLLYRDVLQQQVSSDPVLRTPDLPNPYDTSVLVLPASNPGSRVVGSELVFEKLPLQ